MHKELTLIKKEVKSVYGGTKVVVTYELRTASDDDDVVKSNLYEVTAEIRGLDSGDGCWLKLETVVARTNNEDTLTDEAVESLLENSFNWG